VLIMKKFLLGLGIVWGALLVVSAGESFAVTPGSLSGAKNLDYACAPPFLSQAAKPNIHFVLDITGSMKAHPYVSADDTYYTDVGYWGYFKQELYYKYDVTNDNYWTENSACTNNDLIGSPNCVSGKLLNYVTSNKYDIMRKILTGGRTLSGDATVLEHELGAFASYAVSDIANESTTNCDFNNRQIGKVAISSPDPTLSQVTTISSSSTSTKITVAKLGSTKATFTRSGGSYTRTNVVPGTQIVTSGFANAGNNGTWTVDTITANVITVTSQTGIVAESNRTRVTIKTATLTVGPVCRVLASTVNVPMKVDASNRTFTRTDGGSFVTDGFAVDMSIDSNGFADSGNNRNSSFTVNSSDGTVSVTKAPWVISAVTASTITLTSGSGTGMVTNNTTANARLTQYLVAKTRVKSTTPSDFTGIVQTLYNGAGDADTKADLEVSFFDTDNKIDYTGGTTANSTVKNQAKTNYINAINGSASTGSTNTGPALAEAEKFFQQVAVNSSTVVPTSGTLLIAPKNGASDPYYDPPITGTASDTNSLAAPCRKSFVILVSDGDWNSGTDPVGPAYHMHRRDGTSDLRNDTTEPAMVGKQSVTTYAVYAFGDTAGGRNALITTAIFGGFDDIDNNALPYPFTSAPVAPPYSTTQAALKTALNTGGYTNSSAVAGNTELYVDDNPTFPLDQCNPAVDGDGTTHWDTGCAEWDRSPGPTASNPSQRHTGLPFNFFEATDGGTLAQAMINAVNDILARTSSSTAASIIGNNDNAGASLVQALFYPEKQFDGTAKASWIGEVQSFWYYLDPKLNNVTIREDSAGPLSLNLSQDKIAQFTFDGTYTKVNLYADANGDGIIDNYSVPPTSPDQTIDLEDAKTLWRAGKTLWSRTASDRKVYTNNPTVSANSGSRILFDSTQATLLQPYLDVSTVSGAVPTASEVISYARGTDTGTSYPVRQRSVQLGATTGVWKLGDVVNSTPKIATEVRLNSYNLLAPNGYNDATYGTYIASKDYASRGMAYVGANDGMLHAFKTGSNFAGHTSSVIAEIKNSDNSAATDLGKEAWAFVPKNALPYLQYMMLPGYQHMYFVDGTPIMVDAAIGLTNPNKADGTALTNTCSSLDSSYYLCPLRTTLTSGQLDYTNTTAGKGTSWRSVLIGSMGLGGASRNKGATCTNCVKTPVSGLGYSSFFALDVTDPISETSVDSTAYPKLLWEFSDPRLGYSTVTPAIMRIKDTNDTPQQPRNGRWVAVLASGPTGPIASSSLSFQGKSDMPLTIFVVDLKTGALLRTFNKFSCTDAANSFDTTCSTIHTKVDAMPDMAFGGSLSASTIDVEKYDSTLAGAYSDDAVYVGYTRNSTATPTAWDKGGVLRVLTYNNPDPATWKVSTVIDNIGPVTSSITKLQDKTAGKLWLYFGTGRYFVKGDDPTNIQSLFGIKDPCFLTGNTYAATCHTDGAYSAPTVTAPTSTAGATFSGLSDQTSIGTVAASDLGWKIDLAAASGSNYPQRVITNPVASSNGIVTFTSFTPSTDVCTYGGKSSVWAVKYNSGGVATANLKGQILIQLSTGAFQQIDVATAFTQSGGRQTTFYQGVPPKSEPAITSNSNHRPSKRILHIQER
jgi:Tfp pilus tip-associated adhesin PilY1